MQRLLIQGLYTEMMDLVRSHLKSPDRPINYFPSPPFGLTVLFCFIHSFDITCHVHVYLMWLARTASWCLGAGDVFNSGLMLHILTQSSKDGMPA